jgi:hypothetical protein
MSSALCSSSVPDGIITTTCKTAAQRVYQMPELLQNIVRFLQSEDLLNLALAAKEGFTVPASKLYSSSSHNCIFSLFEEGCDPVSGVRRWSSRSLLNRAFRGFLQDRFAIYTKGVRDLEIPIGESTDSVWPILDLPRWLCRYPRLRSIRFMPGGLRGERLYSVDQYRCQGRVVEVDGFRTPQSWRCDGLSADQPPFRLQGDTVVSWLGCLELYTQDLSQSDLTIVFDDIIKHLTPRSIPRCSPWSALRALDFRYDLDLPLPSPKVLLGGCPNPAKLSCTLSCSGSDTARYMTTLTDILRRSGPSLTHLCCKTKGACVLMFTRHLGVIPEIIVNGTLWWARTKAMAEDGLRIAELVPLEDAKVGCVRLYLRMPRGWLQQSTHEIPVPHEVAQYIRNIFPPRSRILVFGADSDSGLTSHANLWTEILRVTLESLEAKDREKTEAGSAATVAAV